MSEKIQPGDLVMVVKPTPCCGAAHTIGEIHRAVTVSERSIGCIKCKHAFFGLTVNLDNSTVYLASMLKCIPPLDGEDVVAKEKEVVA